MWLAKFADGNIEICEKYPFGRGAYAVHKFDTPQELVEMVFGLKVSSVETVNETENEELKKENAKLVAENAKLREHESKVGGTNARLTIENKMYKQAVMTAISAIGLQTIIEKTHSERNKECRAIVRILHNALRDDAPQDMDDIPF